MASKFAKTQAFHVTRNYAAQAATKAQASENFLLSAEPLKTTKLPNGLLVASIETNKPLSRVAIAYKAGSRNDKVTALGTSQVVRLATGLSTKGVSQIGLTRTLQQAGASLTCTNGREHTVFAVNSLRSEVETAMKNLADVATKPAFKSWELADNVPRMKLDLALRDPQTKVLDALHKVAYRTGLGNPLFSPDHNVGKHTTEILEDYVAANFRADRAAVVGLGVSHEALVAYAQSLQFGGSGAGAQSEASVVKGGEIRIETGCPLVCVALATEGVSIADVNKLLAAALLQRVLGVGPSTKRGSNAGGKLTAALQSAGVADSAAASALNLNYSDSGLFGVVALTAPQNADKVLGAAAKTLRSVKVSASDLARAKAQLKADLLLAEESGDLLLEELAFQAVSRGQITSAQELLATVDKITSDQVNALASQVSSGKLALSALGNLTYTPYIDQL